MAADRLYSAQKALGADVFFSAYSGDQGEETPFKLPSSVCRKVKWLRRLQKVLIPGSVGKRTYNLFETGAGRWLNSLPVDIIHLHWIGNQLMGWGDLAAIEKPIVWTFHDTWPLKSSLHYQGIVKRQSRQHLEKRFLRARDSVFAKYAKNWCAIGPSKWMFGEITESQLFHFDKVYHIPYCMERPASRPISKDEARRYFDLPLGEKIFIAGAYTKSDPRKGLDLLVGAWDAMKLKQAQLVLFGGSKGNILKVDNILELSRLDHDQLNILFAAADWLISPSLEENFSNLIIEAMISGLPVVAFPIGGTVDLVVQGKTGLLAEKASAGALSEVLLKAKDSESLEFFKNNARLHVENLVDSSKVVDAHDKVYQSLLGTKECESL